MTSYVHQMVGKWTAFKKFLNDFGSFDVKELPEIKLWERYLVFPVSSFLV